MSREIQERADVQRPSAPERTQQDLAAQAYDRSVVLSNRSGNSCANKEPDSIDFSKSCDIYHGKGGKELREGRGDIEKADRSIDNAIDKIMDGNYDKDDLIKQLQGSVHGLKDGAQDLKKGIKDLGSKLDEDDLGNLVQGRRDVKSGTRDIEEAIKKLRAGDEDGALAALFDGQDSIDKGEHEVDRGMHRRGRPRMRPKDDDGCDDNGDGTKPVNNSDKKDDRSDAEKFADTMGIVRPGDSAGDVAKKLFLGPLSGLV